MSDLSTNLQEAQRQLQICNACRYCEGYCAAFPAITRRRAFAAGDITQIANLCHNCRGCYYACQYTEPHEFALNLPAALAHVRTDSWQDYVWPRFVGRIFHTHAWAIVLGAVLAISAFIWAAQSVPEASGAGFYAVFSHNLLVAIFTPAFCLPLVGLAIGLRRYWRDVGGTSLQATDLTSAIAQVADMRNLAGGHGEGCNFEEEDRFSQARRRAHQAILLGFLLCFAATSAGTILHYVFNAPAPYPALSLPKLLGVPGGVLLTVGCVWMLALKARAAKALSDTRTRQADTAFVALLGFTGFSGLALYALGDTGLLTVCLALHLGAVLVLFLLTPYTKMAHGAFRLAALLRDAQERR